MREGEALCLQARKQSWSELLTSGQPAVSQMCVLSTQAMQII